MPTKVFNLLVILATIGTVLILQVMRPVEVGALISLEWSYAGNEFLSMAASVAKPYIPVILDLFGITGIAIGICGYIAWRRSRRQAGNS